MEEVKSWGVVANPNFEYCREAEMILYGVYTKRERIFKVAQGVEHRTFWKHGL